MPSKNMIRKGKRRHSVKAEYRRHRDALRELATTAEPTPEPCLTPPADLSAAPVSVRPDTGGHGPRIFTVEDGARGMRLDVYLSKAIASISRSRVRMLITSAQVHVNGKVLPAGTPLHGGERIEVLGEPAVPPLHGEPEDIPLTVVYEDKDLVVINKPAGMMVHAGSGSPEHNRGTLVNALLFHFGKELSGIGGDLRPGIVHRLDKGTSGLILVAKNDQAHRGLGAQFATRGIRKTYTALVHGHLKNSGTVDLPISRDLVRRTRMTTRRTNGRHAVTHWRVLQHLETRYGYFSLLEVQIETGRTHQIRVHMQALGYPIVGDTTYGAPQRLRPLQGDTDLADELFLVNRNFLHAAEIQFEHPVSGATLSFTAPLPHELDDLLKKLQRQKPHSAVEGK